ncbi:uncharacterized protein B0I36DRAFT_413867 [Microdochium trichocladiopsis]|uniref:Uncharacterized protein n=1 Tax=Microdochium trichocladiopsis TaxID=1682393 RepID=A0A9P9BLW7_9PEZI|nr:uncharacterized protein B0I36DRAFT_413867 [Microdochium trichocladiopsis]KAH7025660.1 hypothetical protein B0I36DRAFT_413867 [Microdochium trichocladiopsis]
MKFSHLPVFAAATSATPFGAPIERSSNLEVRQGTNLAAVVLGSVSNVATAVNASLATTQQTIQTAGNNINVQVQAIIEANLRAVATALASGGQAISNAIAAAGGNIAAAVANFTASQINQVILAIGQLVNLLTNLGISLEIIINNLEGVAPAVLQAIDDELALIQNAINPLVTPIVNVANAVGAVSADANVILTGFTALVPGLVTIVNNVIDNS